MKKREYYEGKPWPYCQGDSHGHENCVGWVYGDGEEGPYYAKCPCPCHPKWGRLSDSEHA